jgi:chorismate-pyruvate lyase
MSQRSYFLDPLDQFYLDAGLPLPAVVEVKDENIPEPYRSLLVHERDMTPTLESAYQQRIHLRLLRRKILQDVLLRQVVLVTDKSDEIVEFGAIRIHLKVFPDAARQTILEGRLPLGRVLHDFRIEHRSQPVAYFQVADDPWISDTLHLTSVQRLYGRRNCLLMLTGEIMAEVVEILPPAAGKVE